MAPTRGPIGDRGVGETVTVGDGEEGTCGPARVGPGVGVSMRLGVGLGNGSASVGVSRIGPVLQAADAAMAASIVSSSRDLFKQDPIQRNPWLHEPVPALRDAGGPDPKNQWMKG